MENSREDGLSGPTHDPHEVTVQLDMSGRQLGGPVGARPGAGGSDAGDGEGRTGRAGADDKELPVFVDDSGRRGRNFRRFGVAAGLAIAVYAVVIVVSVLSGNSDAPWLPMPAEGKGAGKVGTEPSEPTPTFSTPGSQSATAPPSATSAVPSASVVPGASASPSAGASTSGKPSTGTSPSSRPTGGNTSPTVKPTKPAESDRPTTQPPGGGSADPSTDPGDQPSGPAEGSGADGAANLADGGLARLLAAPLVAPLVPHLESSVL